MRLLLDENLSPSLCGLLRSSFEAVQHVRDLSLVSGGDEAIWQIARERGLTIITRDRDFFELALGRGSPPKIVWLRLHNGSTRQYADLLLWYRETLLDFASDADRAYTILPPERLP